MADIDKLTAQVQAADGSAGTLGACWDGFQYIQQAAAEHTRPGSGLFPAFASAMTAACDGRDIVGFAPSMPADAGPSYCVTRGIAPADTAQALAALASVMAAKLREAAATAGIPEDHDRLQLAAAAATEIQELLGGQ